MPGWSAIISRSDALPAEILSGSHVRRPNTNPHSRAPNIANFNKTADPEIGPHRPLVKVARSPARRGSEIYVSGRRRRCPDTAAPRRVSPLCRPVGNRRLGGGKVAGWTVGIDADLMRPNLTCGEGVFSYVECCEEMMGLFH